MYPRSIFLSAVAASISLVKADGVDDPNAICYSYGVDFVDEGSYFINSQSTEDFTSTSYFQGCKDDVADVLLVAPDDVPGEREFFCSQMPTVPDNQNELSTCSIKKNQMTSGHWLLIVTGNNGDGGQPFAWQRGMLPRSLLYVHMLTALDLYLNVGTQITSTYTPTITVSILTTPTITQTTTTTSTDVVTAGPFSTITVPSGTAKKIKTITPDRVLTTTTKIMTKTKISFTNVFATTTKTVQATCTTPAHVGKPDKPCEYSPTKIHPAALETPTTIPKLHRFVRKGDRQVDYEWARARIEAAKERRAAQAAGNLQRRAPDAPTTTATFDTPITVSATQTAPAITTTESVLATTSTTTTLPPPTVLSGLFTQVQTWLCYND
jgi:hypothetical protein